MTNIIQALPHEVVQLMAAGEVIDSPAAVVRELVENALDAGASRIVLEVRSQPWRIQVTDNGCGLSLSDLRQAAAPHSTSKLAHRDDLWNIHSLGFRGEALHSLSRLSRLQICSRPQDTAELGYCMTCDRQGRPNTVTPVPMAPGTRALVEDLFYPMPARQAAAPTVPQQTRAIQAIVQRLSVCHPTVTWQATLDGRPWFTLWPGKTALHCLPQILRRIHVTDLRETTQVIDLPEAGSASLYLLLGLPDRCHRRRPDGLIFALNGRPVALPELEESCVVLLRRSLPRDRYPVAFVHLHVPPSQIDWHRAPDKSQVYLRHLDRCCDALKAGIHAVLRHDGEVWGEHANQQRLTQLLTLAEPPAHYGQQVPEEASASNPSGLRALAQVHGRYILAEHPAGLCLVEQHIAHERVLYEALCDRWYLVPLPTPQILKGLSASQIDQLQRIGLDVEAFGPQLWAIRTVPEPLASREDCAAALEEISLGGDLDTAMVAIACRTAIRNGQPLTLQAMQHLLNTWQRTRHPQTCPHGRPICLTLNESSLARYFRRHWVIGKSHGIES